VSFCVLFVCKCVLYYCHWVATQLQLTNKSYIQSYKETLLKKYSLQNTHHTLRMCEHFYPLPSEFTWLLPPGSTVIWDSDITVTTVYVLHGTASVATSGTVTGTRLWVYRGRRGTAPLIISS
jgi:hypothetical protein